MFSSSLFSNNGVGVLGGAFPRQEEEAQLDGLDTEVPSDVSARFAEGDRDFAGRGTGNGEKYGWKDAFICTSRHLIFSNITI